MSRKKKFVAVLVGLLLLTFLVEAPESARVLKKGNNDINAPLVWTATNRVSSVNITESERERKPFSVNEKNQWVSVLNANPSPELINLRFKSESKSGSITDYQFEAWLQKKKISCEKGNYFVSASEGWSVFPSQVNVGPFPAAIRLTRVPFHRFTVRNKKGPIPNANIAWALAEEAVNRESPQLTNAAGVAEFRSMPFTSFSMIAWHQGFLSAWRFVDGLGFQNTSRELMVSQPAGERFFQIVNGETGRPIEDAHVELFDGTALTIRSEGDGRLRIPPRCGKIPALFVSFPGFERVLVDFDNALSKIELFPSKYVDVIALNAEGQALPELDVRLFEKSISGTDDWFALNGPIKTDSKGECRLNIPASSKANDFALLGTSNTGGFGILEFQTGGLIDGESLHLVVNEKTPLMVKANGANFDKLHFLEAISIEGLPVQWELTSSDTIRFPDATLLDSVKLGISENRKLEFNRTPRFDDWSSILSLDFASAVGGNLQLTPITSFSLSVEVRDATGEISPYQRVTVTFLRELGSEFAPFLDQQEAAAEFELPGWSIPKNHTRYSIVTDEEGKFHLPALSPGKYYFEFPKPVDVGLVQAFGNRIGPYSRWLPVEGELVITKPNIFFADYVVVDASSGMELQECYLEINYLSFMQSFEVAKRKGAFGKINLWVGWNPGATMRVISPGYYPQEIQFPTIKDGETDSRTIQLKKSPPMEINIKEWMATKMEIPVQVMVDFCRDPEPGGGLEVVSSQELNIPSNGITQLQAPFPGCNVRLYCLGDDFEDHKSFKFIPGETKYIY